MAKGDDWKGRYLQEAEEWERVEKLLGGLVARLAIVARGISDDLDTVLLQIQKNSRDGEWSALENNLVELTRQVRRLDVAEDAEARVGKRQTETPAFRPLSPTASSRPSSSIDRKTANAVSSESGRVSADGSEVRKALLTLVDEMSVTQPSQSAFGTLRETLEQGTSADWQQVLTRIIAEIRAIIQGINSDKRALEEVLQDVSEELGGISEALAEDHRGITGGQEQGRALHAVMHEGVQSIQSHIDSGTDLQRLKAEVGRSLDGLRNGIARFITRDEERFAREQARNVEMRERIRKMDEESQRLRSRLERDRDQLMRDTLTGALSRLAYEEMLAQELGRFRRYRETFSLAVLDLDFFKQVNDRFGHAAGDKALQLLVNLLNDRIRETDALFRVGGEEFVLLLPRTEMAVAQPLLDAIRKTVADSDFHYEDNPVKITLSAGLTAVRKEDSAATLFARADDAMYRAKKSGRNRVLALE